MAGEVYSLSPMWKYWTPKTQMRANDLGHVLSAPRQLAGRPIKSPPVLRLPALGLSRGPFLKQTICVASDCLQLRNQTVLNPPHLVKGESVFFLYLHLIFCCFHSSAICTCDKVKWGLNVTWDFLPLSCSFLSFSFDFCQLNYVVKKGKWGSLYPLFWLPTVHPNLIFYFVVCYI